MGYWGWRPLLIAAFISVWITGCNLVVQPAQTIAPDPTPTSAVTLTVGRIGPPTTDEPTGATRTQTPATPTPTSTPEPTSTPTPQVYVVQPGDTLLDIALRYGIDLADLRAANAGSDLSLLQIGQRLIIPQPAPLTASSVPAPADILALEVGQPECYQTRGDGIVCLGRIDNRTDSAAEGVSVAVRLIQPDGELAAQDTNAVEQMLIPPRGFAPYRAQFDLSWAQLQSGALRPSAELLSASAAALVDARYAAPALRDIVTRAEAGRFSLSGIIINDETRPVTAVRIVVTLLDDADRVIGYRVTAFSERVFAPGEATPVQVEVVPAAPAAIAGYQIYTEARRL